jgi:hypothetical protein
MYLAPGKNGNDRKMRQKVQHMPYHCKATIKHLFEPVYIDLHTFYSLPGPQNTYMQPQHNCRPINKNTATATVYTSKQKEKDVWDSSLPPLELGRLDRTTQRTGSSNRHIHLCNTTQQSALKHSSALAEALSARRSSSRGCPASQLSSYRMSLLSSQQAYVRVS